MVGEEDVDEGGSIAEGCIDDRKVFGELARRREGYGVDWGWLRHFGQGSKKLSI